MKMVFEKRETNGSRGARRLRRQGRLPGIVYGRGIEPIAVALDLAVFERVHRGGEHTIDGVLDGQESIFLIQDAQLDALGDRLIHVDLRKVSREEKVQVHVSVVGVGHPTAGVLEHPKVDVLVECFAYRIPDKISVILGAMKIGDVIRVRDLPYPEGVAPIDSPDLPVYSLHAAYVVEEAAVAPEGPAEPERIGGKPEEEEPGAAGAPAATGGKEKGKE